MRHNCGHESRDVVHLCPYAAFPSLSLSHASSPAKTQCARLCHLQRRLLPAPTLRLSDAQQAALRVRDRHCAAH